MDYVIQKLLELAESERAASADQEFDDHKLASAQAKFDKKLLRALDKSFPVSSQAQESPWLKDLQELSAM